MFGKSWRIGRIGEIPISVDSSLAWAAVLFTYVLWVEFSDLPRLASFQAVLLAAFAVALFFGSVLLHELAHAGVARLLAIPVEGVVLFFLGGATSARAEDRGPGAEFFVAAAGPATSLVVGSAFWWTANAIDGLNLPLAVAFQRVGWINVVIAVFNALPGFPLDGGRMLRAVIWKLGASLRFATRIAAGGGMLLAGLLFAGGILLAIRGGLGSGIWFIVIGWFIFQTARGATRQLAVRDLLARGSVGDVMGPPPDAVPADLSLSETLDGYLRGHEDESFPVVDDGRVLGLLTFDSARRVGRVDPIRPARDALIPLDQVLTFSPEERLDRVAERLAPGRAALVLRDGALVGAITSADVGRWAGRGEADPEPTPPTEATPPA